jgi:hypothetical protein
MFASLEYCIACNQQAANGQLEPLRIASKVWQHRAASGKGLQTMMIFGMITRFASKFTYL